MIKLEDAVQYEIIGSSWAWIFSSNKYLCGIIASYYSNKAVKKVNRVRRFCEYLNKKNENDITEQNR